MKQLNMSRSEVLRTPTYERRYYLGLLKNVMDRTEEEIEEMRNKATSSNGRVSKTYSDEALIQKMKNNEIPN